MRNTYREDQKLDGRIRFILLGITVSSACFLILCDYFNVHLHLLVFIFSLVVAFSYILTTTFKFTTVIYPERIYITFWPFFKTSIKISSIIQMKVVEYDLSGFGVRYDIPKAITYYKASGNIALSITLNDHKTVVIGTKRPTEFLTYLEQLKLNAPPAPNE